MSVFKQIHELSAEDLRRKARDILEEARTATSSGDFTPEDLLRLLSEAVIDAASLLQEADA
jgi:hypothetical protein